MATMQLDGHRQIKAATITNAEISATAAIALTKLATAVIAANGTQAFTANQSMGGFLLTNVATPVSGTDAANKAYVDAAVAGVDWKASVRATTTAAGTLATSFAAGQVIDGVTLVLGDRILIKDQASGAENGIYVVTAGTPTRATDADSSAEVTSGMAVFVAEGTANDNSGWMLITNDPIVLGTTALVFTQFTGLGSITAGAGLTKTGSTIDVVAFDNSIQVNADSIQVKIADASLEVVAGGIRVKAGSAGQVYVASAGGVATPVTLAGDVSTVSAAGSVTLASTIARVANIITREVPSGAINGSNTSYSLANTPLSGTEEVFLNGLLQNSGAGNDYTISAGTITMLSAPLAGDVILTNYRK